MPTLGRPLNTGVIQFDKTFGVGNTASQVITIVARGDEFVVGELNFTGDTLAYDPVSHALTVNNGLITVFTMSGVTLESGFTGGFEILNAGTAGSTIEAICYARGTMIRTPAGDLPIETLHPSKQGHHPDRW